MTKIIRVTLLLIPVLLQSVFAQTVWKKTTEMLVVADPPFRECHASTLVELEPGQIMIAWFGGSREGGKDVEIWASLLNHTIFSKPVSVANGIINDTLRYATWNPVLFKERGGILYLFYKAGPSPGEWWGMVKSSTDNGRSWSVAKRLPGGILGPIKNKPFQMDDGSILLPSSTESKRGWRAHIERSTDRGLTWNFIPVDTAGILDVIQPSIIKFSDGRLQVLCRSKQGWVMQASSHDKGKTWGKLTRTSLTNPNSGIDAITLQNGLQLIVYNKDVPGPDSWGGREKLHVAVSKDGTSWSDIVLLENESKKEFSYPAVIQTRDGRVHISYTYNRKNIKYVVLTETKR